MGPKQTVQSQPAARDAVHALQIDTELSPEVADHFNIQKLPTLILFKGSQQARQAAACTAALLLPCASRDGPSFALLPTAATRFVDLAAQLCMPLHCTD